MVRALRTEPDAGSVIQPQAPSLLLFRWDLKPFALPDPVDALVVHVPTRGAQKGGDDRVSVAPVLTSQDDDVLGQLLFVGSALRNLALRGSVLTENAAGPALRYAQALPHLFNALSTTRRAQKFPLAASASIILSSVRSETAWRRRWFSFSSSLSRLSCLRFELHRVRRRRFRLSQALPLQDFNLTQLRDDVFGLLSLASHALVLLKTG